MSARVGMVTTAEQVLNRRKRWTAAKVAHVALDAAGGDPLNPKIAGAGPCEKCVTDLTVPIDYIGNEGTCFHPHFREGF